MHASTLAPLVSFAEHRGKPGNFIIGFIRLAGPALGILLFVTGSDTIADDTRLLVGKWLFVAILAEAGFYYIVRPLDKVAIRCYVRMCFSVLASRVEGKHSREEMISLLNTAALDGSTSVCKSLTHSGYSWINDIVNAELERKRPDMSNVVRERVRSFLAARSQDCPERISLNRCYRERAVDRWLDRYLSSISGPWSSRVVTADLDNERGH
jgi:hypothetical protein